MQSHINNSQSMPQTPDPACTTQCTETQCLEDKIFVRRGPEAEMCISAEPQLQIWQVQESAEEPETERPYDFFKDP